MAILPSHAKPPLPAIGVDLGGTKIEAVVLDDQGTSLWRERVATPAGDYRATLATVAALVARAEAEPGLHNCTVGVGTPGSLTRSGHIKNANSTCLNGEALERDLAQALGRPVRVANDANCLALSEATDGAAAGTAVSFSVILGTGIGAGIVVNGRLLGGTTGWPANGATTHCPGPTRPSIPAWLVTAANAVASKPGSAARAWPATMRYTPV